MLHEVQRCGPRVRVRAVLHREYSSVYASTRVYTKEYARLCICEPWAVAHNTLVHNMQEVIGTSELNAVTTCNL
jgi:hypothetical protein